MDLMELYDRHHDRIRAFVASVLRNESDADDVVQETFIRAQRSLQDLRDPARVSPWLLQIAFNLSRDHLRKRKAKGEQDDTELDSHEDGNGSGSVEKEIERQQMSGCVQEQMRLLREDDRAILTLCDTLDLTHAEAAEVLGIEVGAARVRLHRARKRFREILEKKCDFSVDERSVLVCDPKATPVTPNRVP